MQQTAVPLNRKHGARTLRRARDNAHNPKKGFREKDALCEENLTPIPLELNRALCSVADEQRERATNVLKDLLKKAGGRKAALLRKLGKKEIAESFVKHPSLYFTIAEYAIASGFIDFEEFFGFVEA